MKTPLMPTNDWRTSPIVASEPNEGLFAPQEPVFPPAQGCEVVSCEEPEYNSLPFGEEIHEVSQPTTYNPSEEEIEESIDLNDINPDPNALPPFPIWGLPEIVRKMSEQGAKVYGVPAAFFVMYILCAIGAVLKKKVQLITPQYSNYPQLWCVVVAPSGIGKSQPLKIAFAPIHRIEQDNYDRFTEFILPEWEQAYEAAKKAKQPLPRKPECPQILTVDASPEALFRALSVNGGITLCRDELAGFFNDFGRYHQSGEVENLLGIFNNAFSKTDRKSEGVTMDAEPFMAIVGSIQPPVLVKSLRSKSLIDNGFAQRILYVYPDSVMRQKYTGETMPQDMLNQYEDFIYSINDYSNGNSPTRIGIDPEAMKAYVNFSDELTDIINSTEDEFIRALYSKIEIQLCRLALIVFAGKRIANEAKGYDIDLATMQYAIGLCRYFIATGEKVYRLISEPQRKQTIGNEELIKLLYERYNINSQTKLAEALGVSQQAISKLITK